MPAPERLPFTLRELRAAYAAGLRPAEVIREVFRRIEVARDPGIFIHLADLGGLIDEADALGDPDLDRPLWGMPFAVKDNIDVSGSPTTAACPAYTYQPERDAHVVARLRAAGAIPVGKTNLDQFATGLVGVRTPWPAPRNALDPGLVPGGSSSGSAVAVARGIVPFALGTDTAGSGRVPAALNNVVGLKPSLGALSSTGVVPACRTLDTVSVFALTVDDAYDVLCAAAGFDADDPYSRRVPVGRPAAAPPHPTIGIPSRPTQRFFGDVAQAAAFDAACEALRADGARLVEIDFAPFYGVAGLLYTGAWLAERHAVMGPLLACDPDAVHPVIRRIIESAAGLSATDAFRDFYRLAEFRREVEALMAPLDLLCVPSIPSFVSLAEIAGDPIGPNTRLGTYTNFVNLLGLCGLAVPTPPRGDGRPGSVTLLAPAGRDALLSSLGRRVERWGARTLGATDWPLPEARELPPVAGPDELEIAVCGAHMSGLPLNGELTSRGGRFLRTARTAPRYRLYSLADGPPRRPGLVRSDEAGAAIHVEVWALPSGEVGGFLAGISAPLAIGTVELADGTAPKGFLCERTGLRDAVDVSAIGDWRRVVGETEA